MSFSIILPMDTGREELFAQTKAAYDAMPQEKEYLVPTRTIKKLPGVKLLPYTWEQGFNPAMALNLGVKHAKYENVIITSPEIKPITNVLEQLTDCIGQNVICQVTDLNEKGEIESVLVDSSFRSESPAMYFLAMFNKSDIEKINGWDEDFMLGYAYEDNDFGFRWNRASIPFIIRDDIQAVHQYHPRSETIPGGSMTNFNKMNWNTDNNVIYCKNGIYKDAESNSIQ